MTHTRLLSISLFLLWFQWWVFLLFNSFEGLSSSMATYNFKFCDYVISLECYCELIEFLKGWIRVGHWRGLWVAWFGLNASSFPLSTIEPIFAQFIKSSKFIICLGIYALLFLWSLDLKCQNFVVGLEPCSPSMCLETMTLFLMLKFRTSLSSFKSHFVRQKGIYLYAWGSRVMVLEATIF